MILEADREIKSLTIDNLITRVEILDAGASPDIGSSLDSWRSRLNAERLSYIVDRKLVASSISGQSAVDNVLLRNWLDSLEVDSEADIIYDILPVGSDLFLFGYFPLSASSGLFAAVEWQERRQGEGNLSLYNLLNEVGQESGVEYIMLQNRDGIVFASKKVASMPRLSEDPFLVETTLTDTTRSRLLIFQDRQVLETARNFKSGDFEGVFRVGLSLYGYRQIAAGIKRQVWLVVTALIIIGMLIFAAIAGYQNYEFLRAGFDKARVVSQGLLDSIPGPVVAVDAAFNITDANAMARSRFGIAQTAKPAAYATVFPDDPFRFRQVMDSRRIANFEKALGAERRQYFVSTTPLVGFDGKSIGAIALAQDVTDTRRLESEAESRRRLSELGALAASMAHEIRNPLNAIGITIQRLRNEVKPLGDEDEYYRFIDGLRSEIKRLNDIIEKFLAVARSVRPETSAIDVAELIRGAVELFEDQARLQKVALGVRVKNTLSVEGDRAGLTQVLVNLVKNSLEALPAGGNVTIEADEVNGKVRISVADDGPGIEDTSTALKPFFSTKQGGTGLGLATASKIMADHSGELIIESSPGKGCRVELTIPKRKSE
jgi:signal transduction histidine kinase